MEWAPHHHQATILILMMPLFFLANANSAWSNATTGFIQGLSRQAAAYLTIVKQYFILASDLELSFHRGRMTDKSEYCFFPLE